jgi:hypothetical protein
MVEAEQMTELTQEQRRRARRRGQHRRKGADGQGAVWVASVDNVTAFHQMRRLTAISSDARKSKRMRLSHVQFHQTSIPYEGLLASPPDKARFERTGTGTGVCDSGHYKGRARPSTLHPLDVSVCLSVCPWSCNGPK